MKTKRFLSLFIAITLCLSSVTVLAVDEPTEEILISPSPAVNCGIDYSDMSNWAYWNEGEKKAADLFIVCPTVDMGEHGHFFADIENENYRKSFVGALNMELGIYKDVASIYAPFYRQATFPVYSLSKDEQEVCLSFAYEDVKKAFLYYAENAEPTRPLILAGFSQGSDLVIRLMKDLFDEPKYQRRLVAAYCIGWKLTEDEVREYPHLMPAMSETDTGVIIAFNSESEDMASSLIVGKNEKTYSINPLNWKATAEIADKDMNKGACFTDYSGNIKKEIPNLTGAYIDEKRGTLKVTDIVSEDYPGKLFEDGIYHLYDYQFFYRNLQENVAKRLSAYSEKYADRIDVYYNNEIMSFDVEPVIENGRTLVPFRAIFEIMGCAVYYSEKDGNQIVSAHRGDDSLSLTIGEKRMYFNGEEIELDFPAKIKDSRTLVPIRAITEAFKCEVLWNDNTKTVSIYSPAGHFNIKAQKLAETVKDDKGNVLIEAVAYYPVIENTYKIPFVDEVNEDYKWNAEQFIKSAKEKKDEAVYLRNEMGADKFIPFVFELTFEEKYNVFGILSVTCYKYMNVGGMHPTTEMESMSFNMGVEEELSVSAVIDEDALDESLGEYITNLFADKLKELEIQTDMDDMNEFVYEHIGYVQFYLKPNSLVLYFNQGEVFPYALGVISVEVPYDSQLFLVDMRTTLLDEYVYELEYYEGHEWEIVDYSDDKLEIFVETEAYDPETLLSEYYPIGVIRVKLKGISKGNASISLAHLTEDGRVSDETRVINSTIYVDENNKLNIVTESDDINLLN